MSKAVLVMNMPDNCDDCGLMKEICDPFGKHDGECYCWKCGKDMERDYEEKKPNWCPLQELPERQQEDVGEDEFSDGYTRGFNDCLFEITGR